MQKKETEYSTPGIILMSLLTSHDCSSFNAQRDGFIQTETSNLGASMEEKYASKLTRHYVKNRYCLCALLRDG